VLDAPADLEGVYRQIDEIGDITGHRGAAAALVETMRADVAAIVMEGAWVYVFLASFGAGTLGQQMAFKLMTQGELAPWFWWGFVATGLALPLVASGLHTVGERVFHARLGWIFYVKFVLVLVGGLMLRYVIVWGGDLKTPLIFPPSMWPVPGVSGPPIPGLGG